MVATAVKTTEKDNTASKNQMFIIKVKINNDGTAAINYRTSCDNDTKEVYYQGKDSVTEEFKKIFQETVNGLIGCIPKLTRDKNKITMNSIKFDYGKDEFLKSALYSAKYAFNDQNNAVINLNTPPLPIYKEELENTFCISGKDEDALHEVIAKAKAYINGEKKTKQMKLVVDNSDK